MYKDVYIGLAHDKAFDFDKEGNWNTSVRDKK